MVARITSGASVGGALGYNFKKLGHGKAELLGGNKVVLSTKLKDAIGSFDGHL